MAMVLFAGKIEQWRLPGDPASSSDIDAPGQDLSKGQYVVKTNKSPQINLFFAALFDLIICRTTKMGLLIPCAIEGHYVAMRFESHFKSSFGKVKALNVKKLKLSLSPSPQWPQAALRLGGDGRQVS